MGLYIKGEKLPKYGYKELRVCPNGTLEFRDKTDALVRIPNAVIEVPEPHGRLVDENEVIKRFHTGAWGAIYELDVRNAPTVIEAEDE